VKSASFKGAAIWAMLHCCGTAWAQAHDAGNVAVLVARADAVVGLRIGVLAQASSSASSLISTGSIASESPVAAARSGRLSELPALLQLSRTLPLKDSPLAPEVVPTGLLEAIQQGVAHSKDVQAADVRRESFVQTVLAAEGAQKAHMSLRSAQGRGYLIASDERDTLNRHESTLTLRQPLFDRPATYEVDRQIALNNSADLQWRSAVSTASVDTSSAYLQVLQARLALELGREHEVRLAELLKYVSERASVGGTSLAERDRVKARVANARSQIADSRATLRAALRKLESQLGEGPTALTVEWPAQLEVPLSAALAGEEARINNPDLSASRAEAHAAGLEASSYGARWMPKLDAEVVLARTLNSAGTASNQRDAKAQLVLNWSLMDGGTDRAQERAALARQQEKLLRLEDAERKLQQELEAAYAALDAVGERFVSVKEELKANMTVVEAFQAQLVGGSRSLLDVLDAYQRLHQNKLDITSLVIGEVQNQMKVAHLTGRLYNLGARP
jgi:outer membrane protein TolC